MARPSITGWHFDPRDTPQQRTILRRTRSAQWVRLHFPAGTRVEATPNGTLGNGRKGTVERHVPGSNSQGGTIVVAWDSGTTGRHSAITLRPIDHEETAP